MAFNWLTSLFASDSDSATQQSGIDELRELFEKREGELSLTAVFGEPYADTRETETVFFPYTLLNGDDVYRAGCAKELPLPDDGTNDTDSQLVAFLARHHGIDREDVTFEHIAAIEGDERWAEVDMDGDIIVGYDESREEVSSEANEGEDESEA